MKLSLTSVPVYVGSVYELARGESLGLVWGEVVTERYDTLNAITVAAKLALPVIRLAGDLAVVVPPGNLYGVHSVAVKENFSLPSDIWEEFVAQSVSEQL